MSPREFLAWWEFYDAHPFDDEHRFWRPAALNAAAAAGFVFGEGKVSDNLNWLHPPPQVKHPRYSQADLTTMATFGIKPPAR